MFLEKLIHFDKMELSTTRLIFYKYRLKWLILLSLPFTGIGILFYLALMFENYSLKALFLVLMPVLLYWAGGYSKAKTCVILRKYCIRYKIQMPCTWGNRFQIIKELQAIKVSEFLTQYSFINDEKVNRIIESLRFESAKPQYEYKFINIFSGLFSVIAGA